MDLDSHVKEKNPEEGKSGKYCSSIVEMDEQLPTRLENSRCYRGGVYLTRGHTQVTAYRSGFIEPWSRHDPPDDFVG